MFTQRHTAYKLRIKDLVSNEYVQVPGESDYVKVNDLQVSRARVMATIVNKSVYDEKKSGFLVIDDSSETMRVRGWEDQYDMIDKTVIGDLVDIIGRVRKYNEEIYLIPEFIKKVNANWFVLRKLELNKGKVNVSKPKEISKPKNIIEAIKELDKGKGASFNDVVKACGKPQEECIAELKVLLEEGTIYEPRSRVYKVLD